MALRFFCTFQSWSGEGDVLTDDDGNILTDDLGNPLTDDGLTWGIDIFDADFVGDPIEFRVASGVKIDYRGEGDSILTPILASSIRFDMMIQDADHEDLITDMAAGKEGRFTVTIERNGVFYWVGVINSPQIDIEDADYPFAFTITAVDGLALLKNYPCSQSVNKWVDVYEGQSKLITIISRCLKKLPHVVEHFTGLDPFLVTAVNWYSTDMPDPATDTDDPFWLAWLDNRAFATGQSSGAAKFLSCYEAISTILKCFNARISLVDGYFLIEQLETRAFTIGSGENFVRSYDYALTAPTAFTLTAQQDIGRGDPIKKLRGGTYTFIPALRAVRARQRVNALQNLVPATSFGSANPGAVYSVGWIFGDGGTDYIRITGSINWSLTNVNIGFDAPALGVCQLSLELDGRWATRTIEPVAPTTVAQIPFGYDAATWSLSGSDVLDIGVQMNFDNIGETASGTTNFDVILKIYSGFTYGDMVLSFDFPEVYQLSEVDPGDWQLLLRTETTNYTLEWAVKDLYAVVLSPPEAFATKSLVYEVQGDTDNTEVYETESIVGDRAATVVNQWGGLLYFDDPDYTYTANWGARSGTRDRPITQLLAQRIISGQYFPRKVLRGTAVGNSLVVQVPVTEGTDTYILKNGTYDTEKDELNGEWVRLAYTSAELTYLAVENDTGNYETSSPSGGTSGSTGSVDNGSGTSTSVPTAGTGGIYGGSGTVPTTVAASITDNFSIGKNAADPGDSVTISIDDGVSANVIKSEAGDGILIQSTGDSIRIEGVTRFVDVISPSSIGSSQNNYAGLDGANVGLLSASTAVNITGLDSGLSGRILFVFNRNTNPITLTDSDTGSAADNRFDAGRPYVLRNKRGGILLYDDISDRWFVAAMGDLSYFNEAYTTSTATTASLTADTPATNIDFAIVPKGTGAFTLAVPDGTTTGGNARGSRAIDLQLSRSNAAQVASGSNSIAIGRRQTASGSNSIAMGGSTAPNTASGLGSVAIGVGVTASGTSSVGFGNTITVSGNFATAFGSETQATAEAATAFGQYSKAYLAGQVAYANGRLTAIGDAQGSMMVLRRQITGTAQTEIFLDGVGASVRMILPSTNRAWNFRVDVVGTCTDAGNGTTVTGDVWASWHVGAIKRIGTSTSLVGSVQTPATAQADTSINDTVVTIDADDTNESLRVRITPPTSAGSTTVTKWVATVHLTELGFEITA